VAQATLEKYASNYAENIRMHAPSAKKRKWRKKPRCNDRKKQCLCFTAMRRM